MMVAGAEAGGGGGKVLGRVAATGAYSSGRTKGNNSTHHHGHHHKHGAGGTPPGSPGSPPGSPGSQGSQTNGPHGTRPRSSKRPRPAASPVSAAGSNKGAHSEIGGGLLKELPATPASNVGSHAKAGVEGEGRGVAAGAANGVQRPTRAALCWRLWCWWRSARLKPFDWAIDEETQVKIDYVGVSNGQLSKLKAIFEGVDLGNTGMVFCSEVLHLLDMSKSPFTDHLFEMVGVNPEGELSFCHLCRILTTYCVFSRDDILHFLFRQYDTDDSGAIDEQEFRELAKTVNNASPMFPGNFAKALQDFDANSDGLIDFEEFRAMDKAFPLIFFPAFRLQDSLQKHFLGSSFWTKAQEGLRERESIEEYKASHGGKVPDKSALQRDRSHAR